MGMNDKKAGLDTSESSDNEPLIKVAKRALKADKKAKSGPPKKPVDRMNDDSSDDEPLSVLATKLKPKFQKEALVETSRETAKVMESKRTATRKRVNYAETSSDSSDNEPLATVKQKLSQTASVQKASQKRKKTKVKESPPRGSSDPSSEDEPLINLMKKRKVQSKVKTPEKKDTCPRRLEEKHVTDSSSDDDDTPLVNLIDKMKSGKENTKKKAALQVSASTKMPGISEGSSEDEPLINLVKKRKAQPKVKTPQKKTKSPKMLEEKHVSDSSSDDDDMPLVKLKSKIKSGKENTKRKAESEVSAPRKRQGISDPSSEDEPLINLVKKRQARSKVKSPKKNKTPTILREQQVYGSTSNRSDDKPNHPQLTKFVRIILGRCDGEETARSYNKTGDGHTADVC